MKTPSNCTETCLSFNVAGVVKCFRYHPIPAGRKPPAPVVEFVSANGPSMDQSCGTSSTRQPLSSNPGSCARVGSLRVNDQFKCKRYGGCLLCRRAGARVEWRE